MLSVPTDAVKTLSQKYVETFYQAAGVVGIPTQARLLLCLVVRRPAT